MIWPWVRLSRPHFLLGGALMYGLGASTARPIDGSEYAVGQLMVALVQLTAHYANEYSDVDADRAVTNRTPFSGGSGVVGEGLLAPSAPLIAARTTTVLAGGAVVLVAGRHPAAAGIGLVALVIAWGYSTAPLRLVGTGAGELAATIVVVGLVPAVGAVTQGAAVSGELTWAMAVLGAVHLAMMLAFEIPDIEADAASGKRVLAVRLGADLTCRVIGALLAAAGVLLGIALALGGLPPSASLAGLAVLPAVATLRAATGARHARTTLAAVATFVTTGGGLLVALT